MFDTCRQNRESRVRSYCRNFPAQFVKSAGAEIEDSSGRRYIDFLSGCGSLNYGHNHPLIRDALVDYLNSNGIAMSLDLETRSKQSFIDAMFDCVLNKRNMNYLVQFPGPTGASAVEAALKLARKVTGRTNVIAFTNAFHGCSLGALSLTGNQHHRSSSSVLLNQVTRHPFDGYYGRSVDTAAQLDQLLCDPSSGVDKPAAVILEAVQGEGGLNVAGSSWLADVQHIARKHGALLIVDDIQAGCGRTGDFFSFDGSSLKPDIVLLAKSLSGFGLPMSMLLLRPEIDGWEPGEHNGTFRGNGLAFVSAATALREFWSDDQLKAQIQAKEIAVCKKLSSLADEYGLRVKGRGLMQGLDVGDASLSQSIRNACYQAGLIVEACGPTDNIVKLMPPLTIEDQTLVNGLEILEHTVSSAFGTKDAPKDVQNELITKDETV